MHSRGEGIGDKGHVGSGGGGHIVLVDDQLVRHGCGLGDGPSTGRSDSGMTGIVRHDAIDDAVRVNDGRLRRCGGNGWLTRNGRGHGG